MSQLHRFLPGAGREDERENEREAAPARDTEFSDRNEPFRVSWLALNLGEDNESIGDEISAEMTSISDQMRVLKVGLGHLTFPYLPAFYGWFGWLSPWLRALG